MFPNFYRKLVVDINFLLLMCVAFYFVLNNFNERFVVSAEELKFFDYFPSSFFTEISQTNLTPVINANFIYDIGMVPKTRFKLRPQSSNALTKFINENGEVVSNDPWDKMPSLEISKELLVMGEFENIDLWFEVLDIETGKKYKTSVYKIWNYSVLSNYIENLNNNLLK